MSIQLLYKWCGAGTPDSCLYHETLDCTWASKALVNQFDYLKLDIHGVVFELPKIVGIGSLCDLCKNQLECLGGAQGLCFEELKND